MEDKDYHPSDTLKVVHLVLEADDRVDASRVEIGLQDGLMTLRGRAANPAERRAIESDVRGVPGVLAVRNLITLSPSALSQR